MVTAENDRPVSQDQIFAVHHLIDNAIRSLANLQQAIHRLGQPDPDRAPRREEPGAWRHRHTEAVTMDDLRSRYRLTAREGEVLGLLIDGCSNRQIARRLRITEPTVKNHLHTIFLKLDVTDRTRAVAKVLGAPAG